MQNNEEMKKTKADIFDVFYSKKDVVRKGGGKVKTKMTRNVVSDKAISDIRREIMDDPKLMKYFTKLKERRSDIAPPPRPKN